MPILQQKQWNSKQLKQAEQVSKQAALIDERLLVSYSEDFGHMHQQRPHAVFLPTTPLQIQKLFQYASQENLPLTLRGNGMSQGGQSLPVAGGVTVSMERFTKILEEEEEAIWVEATATWSDLIAKSLMHSRIPYVIPYNCNLSIAGVLSAGGIGAESFKQGSVTNHVSGLEVVTASGERQIVDASSFLFQACLGGQGRFAAITKAKIDLRPCKKMVRTFFLLYLEVEIWLNDLKKFSHTADHLESFATPAMQGARLGEAGRLPFAQWFYAIHVAIEYDERPPQLAELAESPKPWKILHSQDESIHSYLHRHDGRFQFMKATGLWDLQHLWYECFVTEKSFFPNIQEILDSLPLYYAQILQIVPIKKMASTNFLHFPKGETFLYAVMILNPGLVKALVPNTIQTMTTLDARFLKKGGKRYLSGYLGENLDSQYWKQHFGSKNQDRILAKQYYDPSNILQSLLFLSENN